MIKFVRNCFRVVFALILGLILIGCPIAGAVLADDGIIGFMLGLVVGLFMSVTFGGFIATILTIDENLEKIANNSNQISCEDKKSKENESKKSEDIASETEEEELKEGDTLIVKRNTTLKDKAGSDGKDVIRLEKNDLVKYIETIEGLGSYPRFYSWYLIETEKGERGYSILSDFSKET